MTARASCWCALLGSRASLVQRPRRGRSATPSAPAAATLWELADTGVGALSSRGRLVPASNNHYKPRASATGERASAWATRAKVNVGRRGISATATLLGTGLFYVFGSDADAEALNTDSC